jgi:hypothetical protein
MMKIRQGTSNEFRVNDSIVFGANNATEAAVIYLDANEPPNPSEIQGEIARGDDFQSEKPASPPSAPPEVVQDIADIRSRLETIEAALASEAPAAPQPAVDLPEGIPQQVADLEDDIKLLSAAILAVQAYAAGAENGDFYWHGGKEEFRWRNSEGVMEPMDAETYIAHFNEVMLRR